MKGLQRMDIESELLDIVARETMVDRGLLHAETTLESLSIQSADYVMVLMAIEEKWGVYIPVDEELTDAKTVGDLVSMVTSRIDAKARGAASVS